MIANQTSSVIDENRELRAKVPLIEKEHREEIVKINNSCLQEKKVLEKKYLIELKGLKDTINKLEESLQTKDKRLFEVAHTLKRCQEDLRAIKEERESDLITFKKDNKEYQIKLDSVEKELGKVTSLYNQLLGKIEIFEKFSKDKN
jgi:seryl-tRNA synthetase